MVTVFDPGGIIIFLVYSFSRCVVCHVYTCIKNETLNHCGRSKAWNSTHHGKCLTCKAFGKLGFSHLSLSLSLCLCLCVLCVVVVLVVVVVMEGGEEVGLPKSETRSETRESAQTCHTDNSYTDNSYFYDGWSYDEWNEDWSFVVCTLSTPKRFESVKMNLDTGDAVNTLPLNFGPDGARRSMQKEASKKKQARRSKREEARRSKKKQEEARISCGVLACVCWRAAHSRSFPQESWSSTASPGKANDWRNQERVVLNLFSNLKMGRIQKFLW